MGVAIWLLQCKHLGVLICPCVLRDYIIMGVNTCDVIVVSCDDIGTDLPEISNQSVSHISDTIIRTHLSDNARHGRSISDSDPNIVLPDTERTMSDSSSDANSVMNYSSSSMTLSEMSIDSEKNESIYVQRSVSTHVSETDGRMSTNVSDKGVQTDTSELVNINTNKSQKLNNYYTNVSTNMSEYDLNGYRWADAERTRFQPTCVNINLTYQDRVSLWVRGNQPSSQPTSDASCLDWSNNFNNNLNNNVNECKIHDLPTCKNPSSVVIASREKVTLRINPGKHERRLSTSTLYEDIEEASEWMSKDYLNSLRSSRTRVSPPPLPPRLFSPRTAANCEKVFRHRRKNLNHLLGIDEQLDLNFVRDNTNANLNAAIKNLQELGRVRSRKDLTKFLGINDVKLRKRQITKRYSMDRKSKSIIDNILNATKHFKNNKDTTINDQNQNEVTKDVLDQGQGEDDVKPCEASDRLEIDGSRATQIEELDHLQKSVKIEPGNGKEEAEVTNTELHLDKSRTTSFSSVASSRSSSSSQESLTEKSAFVRIFRNSSRRFSTSGIEMMESLRRKSVINKKKQSSLEHIPSDFIDLDEDNTYNDKSCIDEFIALGMPVIPFDQPLMALIDSKLDKSSSKSSPQKPKRNRDFVSESDSLDTLIKQAQGELVKENKNQDVIKKQDNVTESTSSPILSCLEEPIYMEMTKCSSSQPPHFGEYMDMDIVQSTLAGFKFT